MQEYGLYDCARGGKEGAGDEAGGDFHRSADPCRRGDITTVKCKGKWLPLGIMVDDITGLVLSVDGLTGEDAETLKEWMAPIVTAVGAEILVTDDAGGG